MTHQNKHYKFSRSSKHRKALIFNLIRSIVLYKKIKTTIAKAKCIKPILEKLITKSKVQIGSKDTIYDLSNFRYLLSFFRNDEIVSKELIRIAKLLKDVNGGYLRIVKLGQRKGDSAHMAMLMFVSQEVL